MDGLKLLREAESAGLAVSTDGDELIIRGPARAGQVAEQLLEHKAAVMAALEMADLIAWFEANRDSLPEESFPLGPGRNVTDPLRFYISLDQDIAAGPGSPRAQYGLVDDLRDLRAVTEPRRCQ